MTSFEDAHVLIVGGSQGIGLAAARQARRAGARVSLMARRGDRLKAAAAELEQIPARNTLETDVLTTRVDASRPGVLSRAVEYLTDRRGPLDVVICCSGGARPGYFADFELKDFAGEMDRNFFGPLNVVRAVTPQMVARGSGHIVLTASTAALVGVFGYSTYAPGKWALRGLAETLRYELEPAGVHVGVLYPPDTDKSSYQNENRTKLAETIAVSAAAKARTADEVAAALCRGIEKNRFTMMTDRTSAMHYRIGGLLDPITRHPMSRQAATVEVIR